MNFQPLGMCISYHQEHLASEVSCKIGVKMWPWPTWLIPGYKRCQWWIELTILAYTTTLDVLFNITIQSTALDKHTWQPLHPSPPVWASCSPLSICSQHAFGMTTRFPQRIQPSCTDKSSFLVANDLSFTSCTKFGHHSAQTVVYKKRGGLNLFTLFWVITHKSWFACSSNPQKAPL